MYTQAHFRERDLERISALIEGYPFGQLITTPEGVPFVSHLPFLFERTAGTQGKLLGHLARANPQWQHFASMDEVLVVFQGPHTYVSPSWYASPGVPTWNYAVVHIRGKPRLVESRTALEELLERLTRTHEAHRPDPWTPNLTGERAERLLDMIVGFEIEVTHIQAKFKLSQNRSTEDQGRVIQVLSLSNNPMDKAVAQLMSDVKSADLSNQ